MLDWPGRRVTVIRPRGNPPLGCVLSGCGGGRCGCGGSHRGSGGDDQAALSLHACGDAAKSCGDRILRESCTVGGFVRSLFHAFFTTRCSIACLASTSETLVRPMIFVTQRCSMRLEPTLHVVGWHELRGARIAAVLDRKSVV